MKNFKFNRVIAALLAVSACISLSACGKKVDTSSAVSESTDGAATTTTLKIGASPAPHAEILEQVKPLLAKEGIVLEIVEFTDYVLPNKALDAGDIDANYFQHKPYLDDFNVKNDTKLVSAAAIHYEPLGLYPGKSASVEALPDGGSIAVPNDTTNEARALLLLQELGLIKLNEGVGLEATPLDITADGNPKNLSFTEIEAAQLTNALPDVDLAVINGNYALSGGVADAMLTTEEIAGGAARDTAKEFANIIAVRAGDETKPEIQKLIAALQSDEIIKFIEEKYTGTVRPAGK